MKIQNSISNLNQSLAKLNLASKKAFNQINRDNRVKSVLILAVGVAAASFTTKTIMEKVSVKSSSITWVGKKVTGKHSGTIDLKDGFFEMENGNITGGEFVIDMNSIACTDLEGDSKGQLEGHLKSDDFFGVENHPTAKLVITNAVKDGNSYTVTGDLTIKETTEPISFDLQQAGDNFTTTLTIDRSKYNVRYGSGSFFDNLGDKTIYDDFTLDINLSI
ncbi:MULTISPECIES: YceI family protein [Leeuwenhoekiella]|jgi:polyisoprenoid-binding protein YceI|uniref:YCE I like family protein n=1 Tax=Leeuwenhoekiella blandensis (strain CECT 7118 / CCUG 51940 / KCTC 22103 / MED217) TaxID=398720 RepID=A3XR59_LEEBM|nr:MULTISPECIES: YceI family protein [Leeuwenhoekiella]EAQ47966.1 YCE I like family protein [Leeuwenhoekiella blandensis MED217]MAO44968.1 YceI family protein [Leeuwenhoekiella sp.]|tara:strand:- start:171 stop:827 length:657 start_codon:yes stop_codon:yes gene_type:complete